jgi:hypothetical protein
LRNLRAAFATPNHFSTAMHEQTDSYSPHRHTGAGEPARALFVTQPMHTGSVSIFLMTLPLIGGLLVINCAFRSTTEFPMFSQCDLRNDQLILIHFLYKPKYYSADILSILYV